MPAAYYAGVNISADIGFVSLNLRFEVSIEGGVFGVPINYHTLIAINHRFKVLAWTIKNGNTFIAINYRLKSTCLNSQYA